MKLYNLLILGVIFFLGCKTTVIEEKHEGVIVQKVNNDEVKLIAKDSTKDISLLLNRLIDNPKIKKITFGNGTFNIAHTIFVQRSNITFQGSQRSVLKSTVKQKEKFNIFFANEDLRTGGNLRNVHYNSLIFDGNHFGYLVLLQFNRVENFSVKNSEFHNGGKTTKDNKNLPSEWTDGIACSNQSSGLIEGNKVIGMTKVGIYVSGGCGVVKVINNLIDMKNLGVDRPGIGNLGNSIVENNFIKNCSGAGILAQTIEPNEGLMKIKNYDVRPVNILISNNRIDDCQNGIEFNHSTTYDYNIRKYQGLDPRLSASKIVNNKIYNSTFSGISISNRDSIVISGNQIINKESIKLVCGVRIIGSNKIRVYNNIIENAQQNVFMIYQSNDISIYENNRGNSTRNAKYELELREDENLLKAILYRKNSFNSSAFTNIDIKVKNLRLENTK